jgi:hypothetical protein
MRWGANASSCQDTDYAGGGVVRSFDPGSVTRRYGLPDTDVDMSRFEGRTMGLGPSGRRGPTSRLQRRLRRLWRIMVEVSRSRAPRRTIFCRNVRQNIDRIARIAFDTLICRHFLRSIAYSAITRGDDPIDRSLWISTASPASDLLGLLVFRLRFASRGRCGRYFTSSFPRFVLLGEVRLCVYPSAGTMSMHLPSHYIYPYWCVGGSCSQRRTPRRTQLTTTGSVPVRVKLAPDGKMLPLICTPSISATTTR